ncbi:MAG: hypothetical protein ABGZ35_04315 [Planctomycetaceae bacterium]
MSNPPVVCRRNVTLNEVLEPGPGFTDDIAMKPVCAISLIAGLLFAVPARSYSDEKDDFTFFREKIAPLLETRCLECHSHASGQMENGLRVRTALLALMCGQYASH